MKINTHVDYTHACCDNCSKVINFGDAMVVHHHSVMRIYCTLSCFIERLERNGTLEYAVLQEEKEGAK